MINDLQHNINLHLIKKLNLVPQCKTRIDFNYMYIAHSNINQEYCSITITFPAVIIKESNGNIRKASNVNTQANKNNSTSSNY